MTCRTCTTRSPDLRIAPALLLAALALAACSERGGSARTEQRGVDAFHSVDLRGAADIRVTVGPATSLTVTASDATLEKLRTPVQNGMLVIELDDGWSWFGGRGPVSIDISLPVLNAFAVNGAGKIRIHGVQGEALALVLQGAGELEADGMVRALNARINGAGNMNLARLVSTDATLAVNGAGNLDAHVTGSLEAEVNGVGTIRYAGPPQKVESRINGIGSIAPGTSATLP